jgi:SAM-dependent methyltransferase
MSDHDRDLSSAFDGQAAAFERAPVQTDPAALARLVAHGALAPDSRVLDAGCGPGLVSAAFLEAGHRVLGVDLSSEMIARAEARCARFGARASFLRQSVFDPIAAGFDAVVSRFVVHHVSDPAAFLRRQAELLRPGGILLVCDHTSDPDPDRARWHAQVERLRDRTHVRNPTAGELVDLLGRAGLQRIALVEEPFELDFDEWFDRGTPAAPKDEVRALLLSGPGARGFQPFQPGERVRMACWRALVRAERP